MSAAFENKFQEISFESPGTTKIPVQKNNLEDIQLLLEALARHQASHLTSQKDVSRVPRWDFTKIIKSADIPDDFPRTHLEDVVNNVNRLHEDGILVPSTTGDIYKTLLPDTCTFNIIISDHPPKYFVSPIFDALMYIFTVSDEPFRQRYFENLVSFYFDKLQACLRKSNVDLASMFTESYRDLLVRLFLPVVKITINNILQKQTPEDLLCNIGNYFKTPLLNQEDVYVVLRNKLGSDEFSLSRYTLKPLGESNGHVGLYYHLDVEAVDYRFTFFTKFMTPPTKSMQDFVECKLAPREHFFYDTMMSIFREKGLGELLDFSARCYLSRVAWLMVFDDLKSQGFMALTPNNTLDYAALSCVVSSLAKFHACSIIYEDIMSKKLGRPMCLFDEYKDYLESMNFHELNPLVEIFKHGLDRIKYLFKLCPDITGSRNLSEEDISRGVDAMYHNNYTRIVKSDRYRNVICHGDLYLGNILPKHDKTDAMLVDFQLVRYCPPAFDLSFLIYNLSTKETRNMHLQQLIDEYYDSVTKKLDRFGVNFRVVFPKNEFLDSFKFAQSCSVITAILYNHITHQDPRFREQLFQDQEKHKYYLYDDREGLVDIGWRDERYRIVLRGLLEDAADVIASKNF